MTSTPSFSSCAITPASYESIVRGSLVRCEDARPYLEASGAYEQHAKDLEVALARTSPENRDILLERLGDSIVNTDYEARVVVVEVEREIRIVPWLRGVSDALEVRSRPQNPPEIIHYWWSGSIEACDGAAAGSIINLWVYPPCCDVLEFAAPACIVRMSYAEPTLPEMAADISDVFSDL